MNKLLYKSLSQIVNEQHQTALVFENYNLDELTDYIVCSYHSHIKKEMAQILSYLEKVSSKHGIQHNELYKISELFVDLSNEMTHHMRDEETILFPRIKDMEKNGFVPVPYDIKYFQYLQLPIIDMGDDDEDAGNKMAEIRKLTNNYTPPAYSGSTFKLLHASLQAFEIDLHHYVHFESSILFPKALALAKALKLNALN